MMLVPALAVVAVLAAGEPLADAREAFAEGRYEAAERLALEAAQPPRNGAALYLVGLARFRDGRAAEALEALDAAGAAEDAPERAQWSYNRAACLYALGRFDEAEQAFLEATSDEALARVAWVNAGFAALDGGAPERAEQWATRAKEGASERERLLAEELLGQIAVAQGNGDAAGGDTYRQGLEAFDAGRFEEARARFLEVAQREPSSGRARLMAGASAYRAGARGLAREDVTSALGLNLEPSERETARDYLDRLSPGLRAEGPGFDVSAGAGVGYDSNVPQVGLVQRDMFGGAAASGSPFAEVALGVAGRLRLSDAAFVELSYGGSQRAYTVSSVSDYSLQLHRGTASVEVELPRRFRLGASAGGDLFFTGLSAFRGLQGSVQGTVWLALDEGERTSTRLDASVARKVGLVSEFSFLTGNRVDATLSQELRLDELLMTAWYRYRRDGAGTLSQTSTSGTTGTTLEYVIPFGWAGHATGASARWVLGEGFVASLDAGLEWRDYLSDSFVRVQALDGSVAEWNHRRRKDVRFVLSPSVSARLAKDLQLSARYDLLVNRSNVDTRLRDPEGACSAPDYACHRYDPTNGNYQKHVLMLELGGTW